MWIRDNEPEVYRQIYKLLQPKGFICARLTGRFVTDYSDASGTNCLDLKKLEWLSGLPELKPSTYAAGEIGPSASRECGLPAGTPVVIGGGDGLCAAVSFPFGQCTLEAKIFETRDVIAKGAGEADYVVNLVELKSGHWDYVEEEMRRIAEEYKEILG